MQVRIIQIEQSSFCGMCGHRSLNGFAAAATVAPDSRFSKGWPLRPSKQWHCSKSREKSCWSGHHRKAPRDSSAFMGCGREPERSIATPSHSKGRSHDWPFGGFAVGDQLTRFECEDASL